MWKRLVLMPPQLVRTASSRTSGPRAATPRATRASAAGPRAVSVSLFDPPPEASTMTNAARAAMAANKLAAALPPALGRNNSKPGASREPSHPREASRTLARPTWQSASQTSSHTSESAARGNSAVVSSPRASSNARSAPSRSVAAPAAPVALAGATGAVAVTHTSSNTAKRAVKHVPSPVAPSHEVTTRVWKAPETVPNPHSLNVAVVGAPNSGKSTLVNKLVASKVSAVSPKYNTTRDRVLGILTTAATQLVFTDTPGFVPAKGEGSTRYVSSLVTTASASIPLSDVVLFVVDAARRWDAEQKASLHNVAQLCSESGSGLLMVANKIDLLRGANVSARKSAALSFQVLESRSRREVDETESGSRGAGGKSSDANELSLWDIPPPSARKDVPAVLKPVSGDPLEDKLEFLQDEFEAACFSAGLIGPSGFDGDDAGDKLTARMYQHVQPLFSISAVSGEGCDDLRAALMRLALPRPWEYSRTMTTDRSLLERVTDIIREHLFHNLHQEVPYKIRQVTRSWQKTAAGAIMIDQDIHVPTVQVARMLSARGSGPIKAVSLAAIREIEAIVGCRVHLFLHVSVKKQVAPEGVIAAGY